MPRTRYQAPERLIGATEYSKHDKLRGSLNTVKLVKEGFWESDALSAACNLEVNHGRKREAGRWELAAVAFVASRHVDLQPWWDESTDELWQECGFTRKPPYNRVWERLRELGEQCNEAFLDAAALVIQRCRAHDSHVFAHAHTDSTRTRRTLRSCMTASPVIRVHGEPLARRLVPGARTRVWLANSARNGTNRPLRKVNSTPRRPNHRSECR